MRIMLNTHESLWVYIVNDIVGIVVAEGHSTASVEGHVDGVLRVGCRVEYVELIGVGVSVEVCLDGVPEAVQDAAVLSGPCDEAGSSTDGDMSQDVDLLADSFGFQEGIVKPLELTAQVCWVVEDPPVEGVGIVVVEADYAEPRSYQSGVEAAVENRLFCSCW